MADEHVLQERDGAVLVVTINRPRVLNALGRDTLVALDRVMGAARAEEGVRAVVLTGAGDRAFAAGADIQELADHPPGGGRAFARNGQGVFRRIEQLGKPVIAAVNGYALGGGCELAMACTLRVAADTARFGLPEVDLGIIPGYGGSQRLPRLVGRGRALALMLTGEFVTANEAHRIGLVDRVVAPARLMAEARELAQRLAQKPVRAVRAVLDVVDRGIEMPFEDALEYEASRFGVLCDTDEMHRAVHAFLDRRKSGRSHS